ncbi:hypothetical protein B005_5013 [Nocardiopsis alba ATCC BAA-2165]|uniref:Uncharacterized protein n=1 Tax=Nocardiopsis alba (strain ATCC BAA-2165 / BE74) TaxID=1205910 RepID=J7L6S3_NOCAA|nr:hypothetical protein B005_5013 [Nocardiopsis alba ATCC BAA-2165]
MNDNERVGHSYGTLGVRRGAASRPSRGMIGHRRDGKGKPFTFVLMNRP